MDVASLLPYLSASLTPFTLGVALTSFLAYVAMGMTGFGPAIIFHVGWDLLIQFVGIPEGSRNPIGDAVLLLTVNAPFTLGPLSITCWPKVRWDVFWWMFVLNCIFFCLGTEMLTRATPASLRTTLASVMVAVFLFRIEQLTKGARRGSRATGSDADLPWTPNSLKLMAGLSGGMSGFLNGAFNIPGPPLIFFFVLVGFDKEEMRSTVTALLTATLPLRYYYYFVYKGQFNPGLIHLMVVVVVAGQLGLQVGMKLFAQSSEAIVQWFILWIVLAGAISMMNLPTLVNLLGFAVSAFLVLGLYSWTTKMEKSSKHSGSDLEAIGENEDLDT